MAKTEQIQIRATAAQRQAWEAAAAADKRTLTDWIRVRLDELSEKELKRARKG